MTFHLALVALVLTIPEVEFDYFFGEKKHVHDFNFFWYHILAIVYSKLLLVRNNV
jgi:hypothetical protein